MLSCQGDHQDPRACIPGCGDRLAFRGPGLGIDGARGQNSAGAVTRTRNFDCNQLYLTPCHGRMLRPGRSSCSTVGTRWRRLHGATTAAVHCGSCRRRTEKGCQDRAVPRWPGIRSSASRRSPSRATAGCDTGNGPMRPEWPHVQAPSPWRRDPRCRPAGSPASRGSGVRYGGLPVIPLTARRSGATVDWPGARR